MQERKLVPVEQLRSEYKNINKWAVIVGISEYKHKPWNLSYAHRDAEELFKLLQTKSGGDFEQENICYLINKQATTTNIRIALFDFLQKPAKEDLVFIFFACHGTPDPSRPQNLYLLTYDTDPNSIPGTGLPMEDIYKSLDNTLLAEKIIVMADTCHSGGLSQNTTRNIEDDSELLNQYFQYLSQSVGGVASLTSAEAREVSREGKQWGGGHGVFTYFVLEGMRGKADANGDGIVTVGELFEYVRANVKQETGNLQHPAVGTSQYDRNLPLAITGNIQQNTRYSQNFSSLQEEEELISDCSMIISLDPKNIDAYCDRGFTYYKLGQYEKAIADYHKVLDLDPENSAAYIVRGVIYKNLNKYQESIADYNLAISLDPKDSSAYCNRGLSYHHLGKYQEAIADYDLAISLDSENEIAYDNRGLSYVELEEYEKAIADCAKAISLNPQFPGAYYNRANIYRISQEYRQAIEYYTKAISLNPHYASAYNNRGTCYHDLKEYKKAIADFDEAIRLNPQDVTLYRNRVISRKALKKTN